MSSAPLMQYVRPLVWLRWRMLMRSLARGRRRDLLERFSVAMETLVPLIAILMIVPAGIGLGLLGFFGGFWVGEPAGRTLAGIVQFVILFACGFALFSPLVFPASSQASGQLRLLLLPIPRGILYVSQTLGVLADPWIAAVLPLFLGLPIGLAAAGHFLAGGVALVAGVMMTAVIVGLAMMSASLLQLVFRNRRRGEQVLVLAMMGVILVSMLPTLLVANYDERLSRPRAERSRQTDRGGPSDADRRLGRLANGFAATLPSAHYVKAASAVASGRVVEGLGWVGLLGALAATLHVVGWRVYRRLLETPETSGLPRVERRAGPRLRRLPGLSDGAAAVAWAFLRLIFRTPRGKMIVFGVVFMLPLFSVIMLRAEGLPFLFTTIRPGFSLAIFGLSLTLLSLAPVALNQFAADGAGLTLECLSPISPRELLVGKAVGGALVIAGPAAFVLAIAIGLSPTGPVSVWIALVLGTCATYLLLAPVNAALSAMFPRKVNLASIGRDSNAHQGANLLGLLALVVSAAPPALAAAIGLLWFRSATIALLLVAVVLTAAIAISWAAFRFVERLLVARMENLLFVAQGR